MAGFAIALIAGAAGVGWLPTLPPLWAAVAVALATIPLSLRWPRTRLACTLVLGFCLALAAAHERRHPVFPSSLSGVDLTIEGHVTGLVQANDRRERFRFVVDRGWHADQRIALPDTIRLAWYHHGEARIAPGERWRFTVRLKRPRGFQNPGGFDYARWLFLEGLGATGYVRTEPRPVRLGAVAAPLERARSGLRERIRTASAQLEFSGILQALTVGDRDRIESARWDTLIATGTNHLIAISGLHIGLAALLGFQIGRWLWRLGGRWRERLPAPIFQACCALALAAPYAALAGFALPTQRALIMLTAGLAAIVLRRRARPAEGMAAAAIAVLLLDPLAPLTPGFWLSFGAVAAILWLMCGRLGARGRGRGWLRLQLGIALALTPLLIVFFGRSALVAPLANLIAVPWVSVAVVPPALAGAVLAAPWAEGAAVLFAAADMALHALWWLLEPLARLPFAQWQRPAPPWWGVLLAGIGAAWLLAPRGVPGKVAAGVMLLPLMVWLPERPARGEVWLDLLDVGQGLAAVVRTAEHTLVYDTGDRFSARFNAGEAVVVPFLRAVGVTRLDALVVSHGDEDHAGGTEAVRRAYPPAAYWSSVPHRLDGDPGYCARGSEWHWDGVRFRFLHPDRDGAWLGNDGSCVLRIDAPGGSILLPGDIEEPAERALVQRNADLAADVVVAPHHGSASSSTPALVRAVAPEWVLYPVGYRNRWDFPSDEVMARWRPAGLARTDCGGALHVVVRPEHGVASPIAWRERYRRFWHADCVTESDAQRGGA